MTLLPGGRILVAVEPVDGRKGIDSLAGVVRSVLKGDPLSGDLFVFKTRRADRLNADSPGSESPDSDPALVEQHDRWVFPFGGEYGAANGVRPPAGRYRLITTRSCGAASG